MSKLIVNEIEKYDAGQLTITTGTNVSIGSNLTVGGTIAGSFSVSDITTAINSISATQLSDITSVGSGSIITTIERDKLVGIAAGAEVNTVDSVNTQTGVVVLDADDIDDTSTTNKFTTQSDIDKLAGIEALADVTDATNVAAAGALMDGVAELADLADVASTAPSDGQVLTYDTVNGWQPETPSGGGGGVSGSGTTGRITKWSSSTAIADSIVRESGNFIGVGADLDSGLSADLIGSKVGGLNYLFSTVGTAGKHNFYTGLNYNAIPTGDGITANAIVSTSGADFIPAQYVQFQGAHIFRNATTATAGSAISWSERMRINLNGYVLIGRSSNIAVRPLALQATGAHFRAFDYYAQIPSLVLSSDVDTNGGLYAEFITSGGGRIGSIVRNTSTTIAYNTSGSDLRLKKNIDNWDENVLESFASIEPKVFHFNDQEDTDDKTKGFIAQDMVDKFPEAYIKTGKEEYYQYNPSGMVVYLMKAIKELKARIETLENK
jgi:hypothetical protein